MIATAIGLWFIAIMMAALALSASSAWWQELLSIGSIILSVVAGIIIGKML